MLYFILALIATVFGAVIGIGGGMIIRPILAIWDIPKELASFSAAITVFAMAVSNLIIHHRKGTPINLKTTLFLAAGSIIGGFAGGSLIPLVSAQAINIAYIFVLVLVFVLIVGRSILPIHPVNRRSVQFVAGLVTGALSGFFGIGGGPFQMAILILLLDIKSRDAAVQSILITLLTTASVLIRYVISGYTDFSLAVYMIPAAIVGGLAGYAISRKLRSHVITGLFCLTILAMIVLQVLKVLQVI